jgi:hypothetical protein
MLAADETSLNHVVLKSPLPALVVFHAPDCQPSRAALAAAASLAETYAGRLRVVAADLEACGALAEQLAIWATPTFAAYRHGEETARACGFLPAGLLRLLADLSLERETPLRGMWYPTEQQLEDEVLVPMLARWGWGCARQQGCALPGKGRAARGVIDLLVSAAPGGPPITLFENKRHIPDEAALRLARDQGLRYASALGLPSLVVAEPARAWVFAAHDGRATPVARFEGHELECDDAPLRALLLELAGLPGPLHSSQS